MLLYLLSRMKYQEEESQLSMENVWLKLVYPTGTPNVKDKMKAYYETYSDRLFQDKKKDNESTKAQYISEKTEIRRRDFDQE